MLSAAAFGCSYVCLPITDHILYVLVELSKIHLYARRPGRLLCVVPAVFLSLGYQTGYYIWT
jgi:hypothetical protein